MLEFFSLKSCLIERYNVSLISALFPGILNSAESNSSGLPLNKSLINLIKKLNSPPPLVKYFCKAVNDPK